MEAPFSRTLGDLLFEQAARYGDAPAAIADAESLSYRGLLNRAARVAGALRTRGVRRGDRIGLLVNNRAEWLEAFFGIGMAGGVAVAFSTWSTADELDWLIQDSGIRALITLDRFGDNDFVAALQGPLATRAAALSDIAVVGDAGPFQPFDTLRDADPLPRQAPGEVPAAWDDAIIIYTSGSSSRPKSVPLSHGAIIENGFNIGERQGYGPADRVLLVPPLFWSYGSANAMSAALTHGAALVLQGRFEPGQAIELIERHRCTALYTLPAITSAIISHASFRPDRVRSLRTGLTIGAPQDVIAAATVLGAAEMCNVYGQTESYGNCCVTPHHWPLERRSACQGPPLPGVTVRITDATTGQTVPAGEEGMIEVRGYLMRGYVGSSAAQTAAAMTPDGFFRTGDMGRLLADGSLQFSGRVSEMIKKSGINISPAEVEDVLMRHPAVAMAGVVGVPDPLQGELLAAFVVPKPGAEVRPEELAAHCRGLASRYKVPDVIRVRDSLPVTVTGKLMRRDLKRIAASLGAGNAS
ncbi:class I adenylate-forming enzyme family protein [Rhodopila sp.]|jgi:fatty-acyl-CoA synthase|uniref:class I adenylate-forming enzyme family protein n=1 Tax=Rhodopila sp. TaxID=2480087 RepID=UPI002B9BDA29|nr:class I adenylate-forming enzyme family protein [Rhodopila sp.]HVZ08925.1 class I adenylate-forming enzyme family protein [Rhodopila sp.]